ncbi:stage II sporulation protein D [Virgibacillus xinjiangensis]|uniref:Stage II sporulation protein D n=1 Tax=Virgibacillus xinjiangensis TaxID=393090 RepID=A0ABV7CVN1_9BACI
MNKRNNYRYQSFSSSRKKKTSKLLNQMQKRKKQQATGKAYSFSGPQKPVLGSKKPSYLKGNGNRRSIWKMPAAIFLGALMFVILALPAMIVLPFGDEEKAVTEVKEQEQAGKEEPAESEAEEKESSFAVEVMRHASETVEDVPLETYVAGVVASEMSAEFEMEALKAQALAARTYIVNHVLYQNDPNEFDVTDTVQHQVYKSESDLRQQWGSEYAKNMKRIEEAVAATEGQILTYKEAPITPAFFSTSNGYTENSEDYWESELPYLRSVESPWDKESPKFLDQQIFTIQEVETALGVDLPAQASQSMEVTRTEGDRVDQLKLGDQAFSGREVREKLSLRSSDFTIEQKNDHLIFTTEGYGHGIGMSQYGANFMAQEGKDYKDILAHYYQGVEISTVDDTAPTLVAK